MGVELLIFGNKGGDEMFLKKRFELKERAFLKREDSSHEIVLKKTKILKHFPIFPNFKTHFLIFKTQTQYTIFSGRSKNAYT